MERDRSSPVLPSKSAPKLRSAFISPTGVMSLDIRFRFRSGEWAEIDKLPLEETGVRSFPVSEVTLAKKGLPGTGTLQKYTFT